MGGELGAMKGTEHAKLKHVHVRCVQQSEYEHPSQKQAPVACPQLGKLKPTGQPPTSQVGTVSVINFTGTLEELSLACLSAEPGTIFDLGSTYVQSGVEDPSRTSVSSLPSLDDNVTEETAHTDQEYHHDVPSLCDFHLEGNMYWHSDMPLLAEAPSGDSTGLPRCDSLTSIAKEFGPHTDPGSPAFVSGSISPQYASPGFQTCLHRIASQACLRVRSTNLSSCDSLEDGDSVRRSCNFDSKLLHDHLNPGATLAPVSCVRFGGEAVTIRNGSLHLPRGHLLLLENCSLALENIHVKGAGIATGTSHSLPLIFISEATVSMDSCIVCDSDGHGVGVGDSATVTMRDCNVARHRTCGLVARGEAASVDAAACKFHGNGQDGAAVACAALARFSDCDFERNGMLGVGVSAAAKAFLVDCRVRENGTHGMAAHAGASLDAVSCRVTKSQVAVVALDVGTVVNCRDSVLQLNQQGVHVRDGAKVSATGTTVEDQSIGVLVTGARSTLELQKCTVEKSSRMGMHVHGGARANVNHSTIRSNLEAGVLVQHAHSVLVGVGVTVSRNGTAGVQVSVGASVQLHDCMLTGNAVAGAQATDTGTSLALHGCELKKNGTIGLFANKGSSVSAVGCTLALNKSSGCEARDRCTRVHAQACTLTENYRVGVYVHSAATMELHESTVTGNHSLAVLCGGREGTDIGGGVVNLCTACKVSGGNKVRLGGRVYIDTAEEELPAP